MESITHEIDRDIDFMTSRQQGCFFVGQMGYIDKLVEYAAKPFARGVRRNWPERESNDFEFRPIMLLNQFGYLKGDRVFAEISRKIANPNFLMFGIFFEAWQDAGLWPFAFSV